MFIWFEKKNILKQSTNKITDGLNPLESSRELKKITWNACENR